MENRVFGDFQGKIIVKDEDLCSSIELNCNFEKGNTMENVVQDAVIIEDADVFNVTRKEFDDLRATAVRAKFLADALVQEFKNTQSLTNALVHEFQQRMRKNISNIRNDAGISNAELVNFVIANFPVEQVAEKTAVTEVEEVKDQTNEI